MSFNNAKFFFIVIFIIFAFSSISQIISITICPDGTACRSTQKCCFATEYYTCCDNVYDCCGSGLVCCKYSNNEFLKEIVGIADEVKQKVSINSEKNLRNNKSIDEPDNIKSINNNNNEKTVQLIYLSEPK